MEQKVGVYPNNQEAGENVERELGGNRIQVIPMEVRIPYLVPQESASENGLTDDFVDILLRANAVHEGVSQTVAHNLGPISQAVEAVAACMANKDTARGFAVERAAVAISLGLSRMVHGGAFVSVMGSLLSMYPSWRTTLNIAGSASGETKLVLDAMKLSKLNNPASTVLGFAHHNAKAFREHCDIFVGIYAPKMEYPSPLSALADIEETIIAMIFDAVVVLAGRKLGYTDEYWRLGHGDIWSGPYAPLGRKLLNTQ